MKSAAPDMKSNVLQFPRWLNAKEAKALMPEKAWELIGHTGSLTEHLRQVTQHQIQHHLLCANWNHATAAERQALSLDETERTWVRRIEWRFQNALWVHARAVFPESTIQVTEATISGLGVQSLGEVIFKDPGLRRSPFTFSMLSKDSTLYSVTPTIIDSSDSVWARQSILYYKDHPLLITEIFVPETYAQRDA